MDSAIHPAIEPAADDLDELLGATGAGIARTLYQAQKADLGFLALRLRGTPAAEDREAAAILLHRIAGTAAYFGDDVLGGVACAAAEPIVEKLSAAQIDLLCDRLLPLLEG